MTENLFIGVSEERLKNFIFRLRGEDRGLWRCAVLSALAAAVLAYHYLIIFGCGNPDALSEGLLVYTGYDWALACGRWATRYMSHWLSADMVIPGLWVPMYSLCCAVSAVLICRAWEIRSRLSVCLVSVLLTVNPTVIEQSLLQYMFMSWGFSNLFCVMFVFFNLRDRSWLRSIFIYPVLIAVAFGLYQAGLGILALMLCMTLVIELHRGRRLGELIVPLLRFALSALIGVGLYFIIMRFELNRWGESESGRLLAFSLSEIFRFLNSSVPAAYRTFFDYFFEPVLRRSTFYKLIFAVGALFILGGLCRRIRERAWLEAALSLVLVAAIPMCANISDIVFPYNKPVLIMQYQSMLVVPFVLALIPDTAPGRLSAAALGRVPVILALAFLAWGYTVSANTTYKVYERAYEHTYAAVASAMDRVYQLPDYVPGEPVAFAGFPDDSHIRESKAYKIAYGKYDNLVFWEGFPGLQGGRLNYLSYFFGVDGGVLPYENFVAALETEQFENMELFPGANSVARIDGLIVVKFENEFELYG